jgi:membrane protein YqaA with SNARE-associated domain
MILRNLNFSKQSERSVYCNLNRKKGRLIFVLISLFIVLWSVLLKFYTPEQVVTVLGVQNVYIFVFLLATVVGVSAFTITLFYTSLVAIALGGVNLFWLSLLASAGLFSGEMVFYYLSKTGSQCIPEKYEGIIFRLIGWTKKYSDNKIILLIFLYSLIPLPNDVLSIFLGILSFPIQKIVLPLVLGNFIMIFVFLKLTMLGYSFFG